MGCGNSKNKKNADAKAAGDVQQEADDPSNLKSSRSAKARLNPDGDRLSPATARMKTSDTGAYNRGAASGSNISIDGSRMLASDMENNDSNMASDEPSNDSSTAQFDNTKEPKASFAGGIGARGDSVDPSNNPSTAACGKNVSNTNSVADGDDLAV